MRRNSSSASPGSIRTAARRRMAWASWKSIVVASIGALAPLPDVPHDQPDRDGRADGEAEDLAHHLRLLFCRRRQEHLVSPSSRSISRVMRPQTVAWQAEQSEGHALHFSNDLTRRSQRQNGKHEIRCGWAQSHELFCAFSVISVVHALANAETNARTATGTASGRRSGRRCRASRPASPRRRPPSSPQPG